MNPSSICPRRHVWIKILVAGLPIGHGTRSIITAAKLTGECQPYVSEEIALNQAHDCKEIVCTCAARLPVMLLLADNDDRTELALLMLPD